jgi:hypothetical protein
MLLHLDCIDYFDQQRGYQPDWIEIKDQKFEVKRLVIDNHQFGHCSFVRCTLVYSGGPFGFFECEIDNESVLVATSSAWRTVCLLAELRKRPIRGPF